MALTASSASMPSDARKAKLRKLFAFRVRTAAPASLRSSTEENCLAFPPQTSNSRLAFSLAGLCKSVVSKFLPVASPLAITSAAASCTALSLVAAKASVFSFSPRSRTTATRHSVSTSAGVEKERFVFILCRTVSLGDVQMRKRSAEHESPSPRRSACQVAWRLPRHTVSSPPQIFSTRFLTSSFPSANSALACSVRLLPRKQYREGDMTQLSGLNNQERKSQQHSSDQRSPFWSTERLPALFAGLVMVTVFVAVVSCSRKSSEPAAIASIAPAAPMATPAPATAAIAPIPTAPKKVKKHRPTTATYVNSEYGVSITYPRKYGLKLGDEAQLSWPGLGPVPTDFVKPGGVMLAAVELPASLYPDTDFASAFVNVSVNHAVTSDECAQFAFPQVSADAASAAKAKVGALEFNEIESINGETPKQADAKYYHVFQNGACYEFALGLGTSGDETDGTTQVDREDGTTQVDREKVFSRLEKILATVKIKP